MFPATVILILPFRVFYTSVVLFHVVGRKTHGVVRSSIKGKALTGV